MKNLILSLVVLASGCGSADIETYLLDHHGKNSVVIVRTNVGGCTGFVTRAGDGKAYTVTNAHCVNSSTATVITYQGHREIVDVVHVSDETDLALLDAPAAMTPLQIAKSVDAFQRVYVIGHPRLNPSLISTTGLVGVLTQFLELYDIRKTKSDCVGERYSWEEAMTIFGPVQVCLVKTPATATTAVVYPGSSGSPALDRRGRVIGVIFAGDTTTNWGYMVRLKDLRKFLDL